MGTPEFAVHSLRRLVEDQYRIVAVVTAPDRPAGRGRQITASAVSESAAEMNLPVLKPERLKDERFISQLKQLRPDLMVVVAFRMLPKAVWNIPALGTFNLHASLLPQYRGAAPINHVLINGETETGLTTFLLDEQIDTGRILLQEAVSLNDKMSAGELHDILMIKGADLVSLTVNGLINNTLTPMEQDIPDGLLLHAAPKIQKEDCRIDWNRSQQDIYNHIRGLSPHPAAWTELISDQNETLFIKILESGKRSGKELAPGQVSLESGHSLIIGTGSDDLELISIQPQGKKPMLVSDFLRGFRKSLIRAS